MASLAKHITFFFLLVLSSSVQIRARESMFFSKIFHLGGKISPQEVPTPSPAPAPANSEGQLDPYHGLYGQGSGMFPPVKKTVSTSNTPTTFENDLLAEELADEKYETGYENNKYNNNGYTLSNYNSNGDTSSNYNNNGYTLSNYNNNGYETERQGMSDTRFVEGGKYYYDVKNGNYYPNGYESSGKETTKNEGYYGNTENSNEVNPMEEYQESQEEYVP
ncbi:protein E6-like [Durio zibethinus]|uniref:Protein E6-like n=1 Tax=Durio zibethinus TaxID=66656 RepID=A0A6P6ACA1_DURZI|nr:protein E6-like isoform X2 [Durio zibethinus]XP_022762516.1 protein E6-like [Durio zibethinus]